MAKAKKERADKYEEKLSIDGSFEDVIGVSVNKADQMKYNIGDYVKYGDNKKAYVIIATKKDNPKNVLLETGFDYAIQEDSSSNIITVFEDDIWHS
ncbi:MAG: hypothetical protein QM802_11740 [Agriterribacter sp.]